MNEPWYTDSGDFEPELSKLEKCRRIQSVLDQGRLIQLDWAGPRLDYEGGCEAVCRLLGRCINLKAGGSPK